MRQSKGLSLTQPDNSVKDRAALQGIGLYVIVFIAVYTLGLALQRKNFISGYFVTEMFFIGVPSLLLLKTVKIPLGRLFDIKKLNLIAVTKSFNLSLVGILTILGILIIVRIVMPPYTDEFTIQNPWSFILISCTVTPICEELMFRGGIQTLFKGFGTWKAVTYTAILFAIFHGSIQRLPTTLVIGLVCGHLAATTKSIYPAIQAHAFINLVLLLIWKGLA